MIALVGNKLDLSASREVETEEAKAYAAESNLLFLEASAKTGESVGEVFTEIGKLLQCLFPSNLSRLPFSKENSTGNPCSFTN